MLIETSSQIMIMQFLFKSKVYLSVNAWKTCSLRCMCWGTGGPLTALKPTRKHLQLSTRNKKLFIVTKRFHLVVARLSKDQRNQVIGVLMMGSTVIDIAHHSGCSRQTIHYLMNRYNKTGYVRVSARPGRASVMTLRPYRVNALTHPRNRFNQQPLFLVVYGVHAQKIVNHFVQNNGPDIFQHDKARPHTTRK